MDWLRLNCLLVDLDCKYVCALTVMEDEGGAVHGEKVYIYIYVCPLTEKCVHGLLDERDRKFMEKTMNWRGLKINEVHAAPLHCTKVGKVCWLLADGVLTKYKLQTFCQ